LLSKNSDRFKKLVFHRLFFCYPLHTMVGHLGYISRRWLCVLGICCLFSACQSTVETSDGAQNLPDVETGNALLADPASSPFGGLFSRVYPETPLPEGMRRPQARGDSKQDIASSDAPHADKDAPSGFFARLAQRAAEIEASKEAKGVDGRQLAAVDSAGMSVEDGVTTDPAGDLDKEPVPEPAKLGFFARLTQGRTEIEETEVAALTDPDTPTESMPPKAETIVLPGFGEMLPVCGLPRRAMGQQVARYPENGRTRYAVYDTVPGQAEPRLMYVTGFEDGCPRQIWAALAMFGNFGLHEQVRYLLPERSKPFSETDKAYEILKAEQCGVERREPCGRALRKLQREGVFLSLYERLGRGGWANMLIYDGSVIAVEGL
jgi:hypothetical protein